jgi:hypothetical protein
VVVPASFSEGGQFADSDRLAGFGFTAAGTLVTGILFGVIPALRTSIGDFGAKFSTAAAVEAELRSPRAADCAAALSWGG